MQRRQFIRLAGGAAAWPLAASAEQAGDRVRRIGVLMAFDEGNAGAQGWLAKLDHGLTALGWIDGRNRRIEVRWAPDVQRMRVFAKELVELKPDVILPFGTPATAAVQRETRTIPIVFVIVSDPVGEGFVASLAHPGGNITGFHNSEGSIGGKWLENLAQLAPGRRRVAMVFDPDTAPGHGNYYLPDFEAAARSLGIAPVAAPVRSIADLEATIAELGREPGGGFVATADFFLFNNLKATIAIAQRNRIPAVYPWREATAAGGLVSYGPNLDDIVGRAPPYVDRILRGASPAELPVQVPVKFDLVINLKTAAALGLTVPPQLQLLADEVIE